jgi:adenylate cyclase
VKIITRPGTPDESSFELKPAATTIGRTKENDVFVLDKSMSRHHARIECEGDRAYVVDLESKNGTTLNGNRVTGRREVAPGDTIRCGDVVFQLSGDGPRSSAVPDGPKTIASLDTDVSRLGMEELLGRRMHDRLHVLLKVSQLLSAPHTVDALLEEVLDLILRILDVDRAAVLLVDAKSGELVPRVSRSPGRTPEGRIYSQHIVQWVRDNGVAALFADAGADRRVEGVVSILDQSIRSSMCAPLRVNERFLGVLYVDNLSKPRLFSREDLDFLGAFASQAAIAIENATLYGRLEEEAILRSTLTRFFPPATVEKLRASRGGVLDVVETEVTALFSDLSGFTAMSSTMRPREVIDVLNEYFPEMSAIVFRHGGTLEKYIGDALMAVWGAPFRGPHDADSAVSAAVDMQRRLAETSERRRAAGRPPLEIHVGLNTGMVAAGNIGSEQYVQYATVGDATNLASRACSAARPGQILVTESTRRSLRAGAWELVALPPIEAKGVGEPLQLHAVRWD